MDTYKALVVSPNVSSKEFLQTGSSESKELHESVGQLRLHWDAAWAAAESWREGLRQSLMQSQVRHHSGCPRPSPGHSQAHVGGRGGYFYRRQAAVAQPNVSYVRKPVLDHLFLKRPTCCRTA